MNNVQQMLESEQVKAVDIVRPLPVDGGEGYQALALPVSVGGSRGAPFRAAPALGADTAAVLKAIGYDEDRLSALRQAGVIT